MTDTLIIGLGKTGFSCANYFAQKNIPFTLMDSRENPPGLAEFKQLFPNTPLYLGKFDKKIIDGAKEIIASPGISPENFSLSKTISDIELFARHAKAPIIGITGTNAKGTVTTLLGEMMKHSGKTVLVGGNIGTPALDLLKHPTPDFYVLEISSFQLEITQHLPLKAATILNMSPDHLDRHHTMENYHQAKQKIYKDAEIAVFNREDDYTTPRYPCKKQMSFGLPFPKEDYFKHLKIQGIHNKLNALAALTLGEAIGLPKEKMIEALTLFPGLPHRCEWISSENNIHWYNDSKGTNIGATIAALQGFGSQFSSPRIILIAGGLGKGQNFSLLKEPVQRYAKAILLIGKDAEKINAALDNQGILVNSLKEAVEAAKKIANENDIVLLSPACASFDQFRDFEDRGNQFKQFVKECYCK